MNNGRGAPDTSPARLRGRSNGSGDLGMEARQDVTGVMEAFLRTQAGDALRAARLRAWLLRVSVQDALLRAFGKRLHDGENKLDEAEAEIRRLKEQCCDLENECPCFQDGYASGVEMGQISVKEEGL